MALKKGLILPDVHVPYHDKKAFALVQYVASILKPSVLITMGDWYDFYPVSFHEKDPRRKSWLADEIDEGITLRADLKAAAGIQEDYFIEGNHENRLFRFINQNAGALAGLVTTVPQIVGEMNAKYVPYRQSLVYAGVRYTHHLHTMGKHVVSSALSQTNCSFVVGDAHRMQYLVQGTLDGGRHVGVCLGWLGDKDAIDYQHRDKVAKDWTLGFGMLYVDGDYSHITPIAIAPDYSCVVEGKLYKVT